MSIKTLSKNVPFQLFLILITALLLEKVIPNCFISALYTLSILIKDLLMAFLPIAIFVYISTTLNHFKSQGWLMVILLVLFEAISNSFASFAAYGLSVFGARFYSASMIEVQEVTLLPIFSISGMIPWFWRVEYGTIIGVVFGLIFPHIGIKTLEDNMQSLKNFVTLIFSRVFVRLVPFLVLGLFIKFIRSGNAMQLVMQGSQAIIIMIVGLLVYVLFLYLVAARFSFSRALKCFKTALPAGIIAFSSMSSAATMPVTISVTEQNLKNKDFASMIIPATTNIQQIGDCFINVFLCCILVAFFTGDIPSLQTFIAFLSIFIVSRFTTAAVMGGAIFIMLPIYQRYLGFNEEMTAIIIAFNVILDPIVTSSNVMANSAMCIIFERVWLIFETKGGLLNLYKAQDEA
ncbi:cation:dicarboxylate symporter family transporter [Candidatus Lariskella endosymbiont of Epinotia ramella]|uniref:cation:dicarboxylate symporter family transporter n=1 Tax=Candidatus Lariskella endosymbiont of Epinotia ramella TaxID=3066224 RepID=UPI0030D17336